MTFELKETTENEIKRLVIYLDNDKLKSDGYRLNKKERYELLLLLREEFERGYN